MSENWSEIFNPKLVRERFVTAGLFLLAHEMLRDLIVSRIRDFFSSNWSAEKGWETSRDYHENVLSLDPKGKQDPTRSSIAWLLEMKIIDEDDEVCFKELTEERNRLAHELSKVIDGTHIHQFEKLFPIILSLATKIERWWIINVELAIQPDLVQGELEEESVSSGTSMLLRTLEQVALGKEDEAWELYKKVFRGDR